MGKVANADLFDVEGLAEYLGITARTIYCARHRGDFPPAVKIGRQLRWRRADIQAWLESRLETPAYQTADARPQVGGTRTRNAGSVSA